jgi:hypothetical protein
MTDCPGYANLTDHELLDANERSSGDLSDTIADQLLAEILRRELDI